MTTLLLTRPEMQSRAFLAALAARGLKPRVVVSPAIRIVPREISLPKGGEIILTSQNAVAALPPGQWRAWCVGERTADAAREAGLEAISADGDVEDLYALLAGQADAPLIHVRGAHAAGNLVPRLRSVGLRAEEVVAYDQVACPLNDDARALLAGAETVVLPLYSPRSAAIVGAHDGPWNAPIRAIAISHAAAAAFGRPADMTVAQTPTGEAMEEAIRRTLLDSGGTYLVERDDAG